MAEPVTLRIINEQTDGEAVERSETVCHGFFSSSEAGFRVHYTLRQQEGEMSCELVVRKGRVEILNHGAIESRLILEEGVRKLFSYATPYGVLPLQVETEELQITEDEKGGAEIRTRYRLYSGKELLTDNRVRIEITY